MFAVRGGVSPEIRTSYQIGFSPRRSEHSIQVGLEVAGRRGTVRASPMERVSLEIRGTGQVPCYRWMRHASGGVWFCGPRCDTLPATAGVIVLPECLEIAHTPRF